MDFSVHVPLLDIPGLSVTIPESTAPLGFFFLGAQSVLDHFQASPSIIQSIDSLVPFFAHLVQGQARSIFEQVQFFLRGPSFRRAVLYGLVQLFIFRLGGMQILLKMP